jgi:phosphoribosylanthranilate isomerase
MEGSAACVRNATEKFVLPRIKVCGVRAREDLPVELPEALDAVGFVAWSRSKRHVTPEAARRVIETLPARIVPVAVMVEPYPHDAERWLEASGARAVQLCGYERAEEWIGFPHPILRRVAVDPDDEEAFDEWSGVAAGFVLDHPASPGGTGERVDAVLARSFAERAPCLLAGGLSADNVATLVHLVRPHGVDASSSLEDERGRKDPSRVAAFVEAADRALRALDSQLESAP